MRKNSNGNNVVRMLATTMALISGISMAGTSAGAITNRVSVLDDISYQCITLDDPWGKDTNNKSWWYELNDYSSDALVTANDGNYDRTYSDVQIGAWYYNSVMRASSLGYVQGYNGKFNPQGNVTTAEILSVLCRTKGIIKQPLANEKWYSGYINYFRNELQWPLGNPDAIATRQDIANYIVWFYGLDRDAEYQRMVDRFPKFYEDTNNRWARILWDKGIMTGTESSQGRYKFNGDSPITRAELCTVICRIEDVLISTTISEDRTPLGEGPLGEWTDQQRETMLDHSYYEDLEVYMENPIGTPSDMAKAIGYMLYNNMDNAKFNVVDTSVGWSYYKDFVQEAWEIACEAYLEVKEPGCSLVYGYNDKAKNEPLFITIKYPTEDHTNRTETFKTTCEDLVIEMIETGRITQDMSVKEKASEIFKFVALYLKYDTTYVKNSGYDAVTYGMTACQGYVSMFNYMCKLVGIPMESEVGYVDVGDGKTEYHAWSRCFINGEWRYSDVTFSDPVPNKEGYCNKWYFWRNDGFPDRQVKA